MLSFYKEYFCVHRDALSNSLFNLETRGLVVIFITDFLKFEDQVRIPPLPKIICLDKKNQATHKFGLKKWDLNFFMCCNSANRRMDVYDGCL
jgi:hypothetical protein